ncbi:MAG: PD-(D/E)XK nuclease family protein [Arcobacteraceae bacterium]|nr:PD-(D/E)XK nuclease family protein [Arcobacteraceae bacterium]
MLSNHHLFVFPTNRSIREYISKVQLTNQILPKLITIGELFQRVALPPADKKIIDKDLRILYLKIAIKKLEISKLGLSKKFTKLYAQSDFIFKFFNELNSEYKTIEELQILDTYEFYKEHLDILNQIFQNYIKVLDDNNLVDLIALPNNFSINNSFLEEYQYITLFYEGYFSNFEALMIKKIAQISNLKLHCTINQFNRKNIELFKIFDFELEPYNEYILDISNSHIVSQIKLQNKELSHTIYPISLRISQIALVKYAIASMVNKGIEASKIVLILPDEKFAKYIKSFDNEKYFNFAMGNDISNSKLYQMAHIINDYFNIDEPKYKKKVEYFNLNISYLNLEVKPFWEKPINKERFFSFLDFICSFENDEEIQEKIKETKFELENLLFQSFALDELLFKDGFKIFLTKIVDISTDDIQAGKITVMGILETRAMQYDGVIVIDFNDNTVPKKSVKDKFISSHVKKHSNLPTPKDRENLQKYYYQKLFDGAKEIYISYVVDKEHTASRFLNELFKKPNIVELDVSNILKDTKEIFYNEKNIIQEINLSKLEWSATSLKIFLDCKRKYYLQYIQKIDEHTITLKPKSYELGNILHTILEKNYKDKKFTYEEVIKEISKYQNINPYLTIELELWKKKLQSFFQYERKRFDNGISIYELEKPFRVQINGITLKGKIDRIDRLQDGTFAILDYKTSSNLKIDSFKTYDKSSDFQLEFYFLATKDLGISQVGYYDLNDGKIKEEITIEPKLERLFEILKSLETQFVNFEKCEKEQLCEFCPYKIICNKE